jgi:uncharacterized protein YrrD
MSSPNPAVRNYDENSISELRKRASTGRQLMGLPVISIDDGESQGKIHDVVYDPRQGRLIGFVVQRGGGFLSRPDSFWLASEALHALGEDAATVPSAASLQPAGAAREQAETGADAGEPVLGKRLLTEGGKFLGNVDDVLIDRESRRVVAYEVSGGVWQDMMRGQTAVPVDQIISIGSAAVIVPDIVADRVAETTGGLAAATETARERIDQARTEVAETIEEKEASFARGRTAANAVYDEDGSIIVLAGETITDAHIARAIAAGKMHALALTAGKAEARDRAAAATTVVRERAADLGEAAQDRQAALLVGRVTGRAVLTEAGAVLVPADHIVNEVDVAAARAAGRLNDLTAAVGMGAWEAARERFEGPEEPRSTGAVAPVIIESPATVVIETPPASATETTASVPSTPVVTAPPGEPK